VSFIEIPVMHCIEHRQAIVRRRKQWIEPDGGSQAALDFALDIRAVVHRDGGKIKVGKKALRIQFHCLFIPFQRFIQVSFAEIQISHGFMC
jgi:hypothetical protein